MSTYRRVGGTSNIDESLFGTSEREKILSGVKSNLSSSADKRRNKSASKSLTLPPATAIVLTSSELDSIKVRENITILYESKLIIYPQTLSI
jgi:hypothetical protein